MNDDAINERLESKLAAAERSLLIRLRDVAAQAAAKGALQSSGRIRLMIDALGLELDALTSEGLGDVAVIERNGGSVSFLYDTLGTKVVHLRLRGDMQIAKSADWAGPAATNAAAAETGQRAGAALLRIKQHRQGFDRDHVGTPAHHYSISHSPGAVLQAGSPGATATVSVQVPALVEALERVEEAAKGLDLDQDTAAELQAEMATIRAQLGKRAPTPLILRESAKTIRAIGENLAAGAMQPGFMLAAHALVAAAFGS